MTDFRAWGAIMGPTGLTAVFGMGTGVAPSAWPPERRPAEVFRSAGRVGFGLGQACSRRGGAALHAPIASLEQESFAGPKRPARPTLRRSIPPAALVAGGRSGWSSRSAVRTGRLRRLPALHVRPIDLVVFQEPSRTNSAGNLVSEGASRLDAFSAYPDPTWLPGGAADATTGTPEVGPPQSSRTRGESPQVSHAHGR